MKSTNHMNTEVFTWKPSDWGENHGSFTIFKIYFARFNPSWGNNPLQFTLGEHRLHLYNLLPDTNRKGLQPLQAYYVGPSTTLPPCNDKWERKTQDWLSASTANNC